MNRIVEIAKKDKKLIDSELRILVYISSVGIASSNEIKRHLHLSSHECLLEHLLMLGYLKNEKGCFFINKEFNSISFNDLLELQRMSVLWCEKSLTEKESKPLFIPSSNMGNSIEDYIFNKNNILSGDAIIFQYLFYCDNNRINRKIKYENLGMTLYYKNNKGKSSLSIIMDGEDDIYTIVWSAYPVKDSYHLNIEDLLYNGRSMNMERYLYLLNTIQNRGLYKFNINNIWNI